MSDLGVDPVVGATLPEEGGSVTAALRLTAQSHGASFAPVPFDSYLSRLEKGDPICAAVFERSGDDLQVGLGLVTLGGETYMQLVGSQAGPQLIPLSSLSKVNALRVWFAEGKTNRTLALTVGNASIDVDRLWQNLGLTEPFSKASATFHVANRGPSSVHLELITVSCGCLTVECDTTEPLERNQSRAITVRVKTGDKASYRHNVVIRIRDLISGSYRDLAFGILGNQLRVLSAVPGEIDFGRVRRGDAPIYRTLRLTSSRHDPFEITSVANNDLPISHTITSSPGDENAGDGAETKVELSLDTAALQPGALETALRIESTSRYRPMLEVPLRLVVLPHVEAVPGLVSFGAVATNTSKEQRIDLISTDGRRFFAQVRRAPDDCDVEITAENETTSVRVKAHFGKEGPFERFISLRVASTDWDEEISLRCVALVRSR